jgi:uncharacterized protein involved in outer membrane biogenesis
MRRRTLIIAAVIVLVLLLIPIGLFGTLWLAVSSGSAKRWATDAAQSATGHEARISGTTSVAFGLVPKLVATGVALLNPPGFSRPNFAEAGRIEARVALLPLLAGRIEVRRLRLDGLDVRLEVNAAGQANWRPVPGVTQSAAAPSPGGGHRFAVVMQSVEVSKGKLAWDGPGGPLSLDIPELRAQGTDTLALSGKVELDRLPLTVGGDVHPSAPWATLVTLSGNGVSLAVHAQQVAEASRVSVDGKVEGAAIAPVFDQRLADLGLIAFSGAWAPGSVTAHAQAGPGQLPEGVHLDRLTLDAPALDQAVSARAELSGAAQLSVAGQIGTLAGLLANKPSPVSLSASGPGGTAELRGTVADPAAMHGLNGTLSAHISDLAKLLPSAPPVRDAVLAATLATAADSSQSVAVHGLSLTLPQGDLAGDLAVSWQKRPAVHGTLASQRLDVDAIAALLRSPAALPAEPSAAAPPPVAVQARVIPDTPVPVAGLKALDADLAYTAAQLRLGGMDLHDLRSHAHLEDGRLRLDPISAVTPGGPMQAQAGLDASASTPVVTLRAQAPGLALAAILPGATGVLQVNADLGSTGTTWRRVATGLGGEADATLADGALDLGASPLLGEVLRAAHLPVVPSGRVQLRCLAVRAQGTGGIMRLDPLLLDASRFVLRGSGQVDLGSEVPDLHLQAALRLGKTEAEVPLQVAGTLASPKIEQEAVNGRFGLTTSVQGEADDCGPALSSARGGRPGPMPAPLRNSAKAERPLDLLRQLLR